MPANVRRQLNGDPCPECRGTGAVYLASGEVGDARYELYYLGYKPCERCGGTGELPPPGLPAQPA